MNLTDDMVLKFQRGTPILLDDICAIYSVTLGEIVDIGYSTFQQYLGTITTTKPEKKLSDDTDIDKLVANLTDFQYILLIATMDPQVNDVLSNAFKFFTHENVIFSLDPAQIIVGPPKENHILTEEKFYDFQYILRHMYFLEQEGDEIIINPNDPPSVVKLKKQMIANRKKVRQAKAKQAKKDGTNLELSDLIGSLTINNCGLNMENIWNITYYAFHDQLKRMGWRDQFNINNQAALAGAKLKKDQLKHWIRSIADLEKS